MFAACEKGYSHSGGNQCGKRASPQRADRGPHYSQANARASPRSRLRFARVYLGVELRHLLSYWQVAVPREAHQKIEKRYGQIGCDVMSVR